MEEHLSGGKRAPCPGESSLQFYLPLLPETVEKGVVLKKNKKIKKGCLKSICSSLVLDEMEKQSTCELEVDAVAADILNRIEIQSKLWS